VLIAIFTGCGGDDNGGGGTTSDNNPPSSGSTANQSGYIINAGTNEIRAMTVDGTTGNLALVTGSSPIATGILPHDVQVDRQGRYVYVANHESSFVSGWRINTDGSLTPINPSTAGSPVTNLSGSDPTEDRPHSSVMDKDGQYLYVVAGIGPATLKVYQIQTAPGATQGTLTAMTGQSFAVGIHAHRVRMSPNGQFLYVAAEDSGEVYAFSRNPSTGALTRSSTPKVTGLSGALDVQVDSQNKFLFASYINAVEVMSIGADGSPTRISPVSAFSTNNNGQGSGPHSMVIHPNGQSLYTANINAHTLTVFKVDPASGVLTEVLPNPQTGADPNYVFIHPNGQILYSMDTAVSQVSKFTINGDGSLTAPEIIGSAIVGVGPNGIATTNK
jgi:6-phosphogluconolactonase (cycloisomerase 2 family)